MLDERGLGLVVHCGNQVRSMFYAFYALGCFFRNRGPLQKVCRDTDTHASPQLPPGAALSDSAACMEELPCDKTQGSAVGTRHGFPVLFSVPHLPRDDRSTVEKQTLSAPRQRHGVTVTH
jgi:hypothetical protein